MQALLVVADIGGYTRFLKVHRINLAHAQDVVARLLEAVIDAAAKLKLSKLEGDAALFYADDNSRPDVVDEVRRIRTALRARSTRW